MQEKVAFQPQAQNEAAVALQAKFKQGIALHQQGKLAEAERIYEEVLRQQPNHFDALHLLGIIALQTGRTERAVELIRRAIGLNAKIAAAHSNLGNGATRSEASRGSAGELRQGDRAEARLCRGIQQPWQCAMDLKRPEEALASYDRAIALRPDYAEAYNNRGNALMDLKRPADALASYDKAIALKPDYTEAYYNRGNALMDLKRPADALASYDKAIALKSRLCRGIQQPWQCADRPEASRRCAGELRQGDRAQARLYRGIQQPWQCADGPEASRRRAGELRQGDRA